MGKAIISILLGLQIEDKKEIIRITLKLKIINKEIIQKITISKFKERDMNTAMSNHSRKLIQLTLTDRKKIIIVHLKLKKILILILMINKILETTINKINNLMTNLQTATEKLKLSNSNQGTS